MPTEIAIVHTDVQKKHKELTETLPVDKQVSWLTLAKSKQSTLEALRQAELHAQRLLLNWENKTALELQEGLAAYKKAVTQMQETRKGFTRFMDMISDELMQPEKRAQVWDVVAKAEARRIELVKSIQETNDTAKAKALEITKFKAHVSNEYTRIEAEYQTLLLRAIRDYYKNALSMDLDEQGLKKHLDTSIAALGDIKAPDMKKFEPQLHTKQELIPIWQTIKQPDYLGSLKIAKDGLIDQYKMYFNDKHNPAQAIAHVEAENLRVQSMILGQADTRIATNTLVAQAAEFEVIEPDGVKPIKKLEKIVVSDTDSEKIRKIIAAFLGNWYKAWNEVSVKKFGNLTVAQMAAALDKAEIKVEGIEYQTIEK